MIIVTIDLKSAKDGSTKRLGKCLIINDGTGNGARGNYDVMVAHKTHAGAQDGMTVTRPQRQGRVLNFPRVSYNVWRLVIRSLLDAFPEEKAK